MLIQPWGSSLFVVFRIFRYSLPGKDHTEPSPNPMTHRSRSHAVPSRTRVRQERCGGGRPNAARPQRWEHKDLHLDGYWQNTTKKNNYIKRIHQNVVICWDYPKVLFVWWVLKNKGFRILYLGLFVWGEKKNEILICNWNLWFQKIPQALWVAHPRTCHRYHAGQTYKRVSVERVRKAS